MTDSSNLNLSDRWLDRDPVLSEALNSLRNASSKYQAQVALNIIKIVVEHQIEDQSKQEIDNLVEQMNTKAVQAKGYHRRWYDANETLSAGLALLQDCPEDIQLQVIPAVAQMIKETLKNHALI